jgi:phosphatidylglycerophosphate synthase
MFDRHVLAASKPVIDALAHRLNASEIKADHVSLAGFGAGLVAALMIAGGYPALAIFPLALNRLADGLDGALARLQGPTDRGAFLDITLDFLFYGSVPLAFAVHYPADNALAAALLLSCFIGTGSTFLAFAILAAKRGEKSAAYPSKAFYYLGGLTEGFETITCFLAMCWWPQHFAALAYGFALLCAVTTLTRLHQGYVQL